MQNWGEIGQKLKRPISLFDQMRGKGVLTNWCWYEVHLDEGKYSWWNCERYESAIRNQFIYCLDFGDALYAHQKYLSIANAIKNRIKIDVPLRYLNPFCGHSCVAGIHSFAPPSQSIMRVCYKQPSAHAPFILGLSSGTKFRTGSIKVKALRFLWFLEISIFR